jgi:mono/diheme cytochrome c family protein
MNAVPRAVLFVLFGAAAASAAPPPSQFQQGAAVFAMKCAKCHTVGRGDRVGPDLRGVADRHEREWILNFVMHPGGYLDTDPAAKELLQRFNGVRMEETHLTRTQAEGVFEYVKAAAAGPQVVDEDRAVEDQPLVGKLRMPDEHFAVSLPALAGLLLFLAAATGFWQAGLRAPALVLLLVAASMGYWAFGGRRYYHLLGNQQGYAPVQPLPFSHQRHAGAMGISCFYCHYGAERSDVAGVPAVSVCMNCHAALRKVGGSKEPSAAIAELASVWEARASSAPATIPWVRVHQLPDYVHFSHRAHIDDNIQCQECHGPVQEMERVRQAASLSMGWCINCHRQKSGEAPTHWRRAGGPLDCSACHW